MPPQDDPPPAPAATDTARRDYRQLRRWLVAMLIAACAGPLSMNLVDPDLWGHLQYGRDWVEEGALPRTATHTYTAEGHPWINHENLAELALTYGFASFGAAGMLTLKCLLGLAVLGAMWFVAERQGAKPIATWVLMLLIATNLQAFWLLRPQLMSFLLFAVMLLALDRATRGWGARRTDFVHNRRGSDPLAIDFRWLAPLPLMFAVWVNSHGGFVAGLAVLWAFLGGRSLELLWRRGKEARSSIAGMAAVGIGCVLATFVNPYGFEMHAWLIDSLGAARPEITEWLPPTPDTPVFWPFVTLVATAAATLWFTQRRRDPLRVLILLLVGWQAASHLRHIAFFALLCGFWLPLHLQSVAHRLRRRAARGMPIASITPRWKLGLTAVLSAMILLQSIGVGRRLATLPVEKSRFPVDAVEWMAENGARGKLVVCFNWAQYAIAALAPDVRVSFDGRFRTCYPREVVDMNFDFLVGDRSPRNRDPASGPIDPARVLTHGEPDYVLVDRGYWHAVGVMLDQERSENSEWVRLYQDGIAQLWGRRSVVDRPDSDRFVPKIKRTIKEDVSLAVVEWPALPGARSLAPERDRTPQEIAHRPVAATSGDDG